MKVTSRGRGKKAVSETIEARQAPEAERHKMRPPQIGSKPESPQLTEDVAESRGYHIAGIRHYRNLHGDGAGSDIELSKSSREGATNSMSKIVYTKYLRSTSPQPQSRDIK